jgi:NAD+ synthase (glutamine-hydrolysing)
MRIALLQLNPVVGDLAANASAIAGAVRSASAGGARLCVTSELALCGYPPRDLLLMDEFISACRGHLDRLAQELADCCPVGRCSRGSSRRLSRYRAQCGSAAA